MIGLAVAPFHQLQIGLAVDPLQMSSGALVQSRFLGSGSQIGLAIDPLPDEYGPLKSRIAMETVPCVVRSLMPSMLATSRAPFRVLQNSRSHGVNAMLATTGLQLRAG